MASKVNCIIIQSDEGAGAKGVRCDNDENVYFPVKIADAMELEEFDEVEAVIVKNEHPAAPWLAIRARRIAEAVG